MPRTYGVFGDMRVIGADGETQSVTGRQAAVLGLLVAARPDGVSRDSLIEQVWGADQPADPESTLYSVISRLRAVVGDDLTTTPNGYRLKAGTIDTEQYESAVAQARSRPDLHAMEAADLLWTGEPFRGLEDIPDVRLAIESLHRIRRWATRDRLELMTESGRGAQAADELDDIMASNPFDEETLGLFMRASYRAGRKPAALRAFREYEDHLRDETGLEPSAHLRELELAILTDHIDAPERTSSPLIAIDLAISYVDVGGGHKIAVGRSGNGPPLLIHPGWMSKLDLLPTGFDMRTPLWAELAKTFEIVIFDRGGTGLSRDVPVEPDLHGTVEELISVVVACFNQPVPILAGSAAGPIAVKAAVARPEIFSHLILHGTYASGPATFPPDVANSLVALVRAGWGMGSDLLANLLFPSASTEIKESWSQTQRGFADAETAAVLLRQMYDADASAELGSVDLPTLVVHYRDDKAIPIRGAEQLAAGIPHARLVPLDGRTHYPLPGEESSMAELISDFVGASRDL